MEISCCHPLASPIGTIAKRATRRYFKVEVYYFKLEVFAMTKSPLVFHLIQQANSLLLSALDGLMKSREVIVTAHQVILFVLMQQDGLPSAEIAKRAGMSQSRLTGLVDTLVKKHLVRREKSPSDGRVHCVFIEPDGKALIKRTTSLARDLNENLLHPFSEAERKTISRFLTHVADTAKTIEKP